MTTTLFKTTLLTLSVATLVVADTLYVAEGVTGTYYYDYGYETTGDRCAGRGSGSGTLSAVPYCENNGPTYETLATNRIVALNRTLINSDKSAWCGKEVKVFTEDGKEVAFDEPLVAWDVCEAAETSPIADFSVDAYLKMMPNGDCMANNGNNPTGLRIEITDNQIWAPAPGSDSYSPTAAATIYQGGGYNGVNPTGTVIPPWKVGTITAAGGQQPAPAATTVQTQQTGAVTSAGGGGVPTTVTSGAAAASDTAVAAVAGGAGGCDNKGDLQCQGNALYICNYQSNSPDALAWQKQYDCPGGCDADAQIKCKSQKKRSG
ncbi:hypothetical protein IAT38_002247 [Cryptococcus sp. DSM 104549]